jgi:putative two-component system response regulator
MGEEEPWAMKADQAVVLVVDDNELNRDMLSRWLERQGHNIVLAENGRQALEVLKQVEVDLMLLDIMMPEMNGYQVLEALKAENRLLHLPVIVISAVDDLDSVVKCIELGAEEYVTKPFNRVMLHSRVAATLDKKRLRDQEEIHRRQIEEYNLHLEQRVQEQVRQISSIQRAVIFALARLSESRDDDTGTHLERVREYCKVILEPLSHWPEYAALIDQIFSENIYAASPLHDIGKVAMPDNILLKPAQLTTPEFEIIKTHTTIGANTLRAVDREYPGNSFIRTGIEIAECHHEKWDGSGYPSGLAGDAIPLAARIVALADVYDALTSTRVYKRASSHVASVAIIMDGRGQHFDPYVVDAFQAVEKEFETIRRELHDLSA